MTGALADGLDLLNRRACMEWLLRRLHPQGPGCPQCRAELSGNQLLTWWRGGRVHCHGCGTWFTARTGTPLCGSSADPRQVVYGVLLLDAGVTAKGAARACRLAPDTVRVWSLRLALRA